MSPKNAQSYVKARKTDGCDAKRITEAATGPMMPLVTQKIYPQLDLQVLHRARQRLATARTWLTNQLRDLLLERGIILPKRQAFSGQRSTS